MNKSYVYNQLLWNEIRNTTPIAEDRLLLLYCVLLEFNVPEYFFNFANVHYARMLVQQYVFRITFMQRPLFNCHRLRTINLEELEVNKVTFGKTTALTFASAFKT